MACGAPSSAKKTIVTKFPVTMKRAPNKRNKKMEINIVKTDAPGFIELNFSMKIALTTGAPNENIVQNHLYIALLNIF